MTLTLPLQSTGDVCCVTQENGTDVDYAPANAALGAREIRGRTSSWEIFDPELVCSMITLTAPLAAQFDKDMGSGAGIVMEFRSYNMVTTAIQNATTQLAIHAAFSSITDVLFCFSHDFVALTGAGAGTVQMPFFAGGANTDAQTRFRRHL